MPEYADYAARLDVNYPGRSNRLTVLIRLILAIPVIIIVGLINGTRIMQLVWLLVVLALLIVKRYPEILWTVQSWFAVFSTRTTLYIDLLADGYPWNDDPTVRIELDEPDGSQLSRFLPLIKWLLALPHYIVLALLGIVAFVCIVLAWLAILITGSYPAPLFNFVLGVNRWGFRVNAYVFVLNTDRYPPFSLKA